MIGSSRRGRRAAVLVGVFTALAAAVGLVRPDRPAAAQPAQPPAAGLDLVPADAALFVHLDVAHIWGGPIAKAVRAAEPKAIGDVTAKVTEMFGVGPDNLRTVTAFAPKIKGPQDAMQACLVLAFDRPVDKAKLTAGVQQLAAGSPVAVAVQMLNDRTAVVLTGGLGEAFAKPRGGNAAGPLADAIREAKSGKYVLVAGSALANLPDEIRGNDLPPDVAAFRPLLKAEAIAALVSATDKEIAAEVRVKTASPAAAADAQKALTQLRGLMEQGLGMGLKETASDPATKNTAAILKAAEAALKNAEITVAGSEARATAKIPADLPFAPALGEATVKVKTAAAAAQTTNNLKQIGLAMHVYHDANGAFPPAAVCDKKGKPLLSWRVLVLPYIEQQQLYQQFKLDEPWDSPNNKKLLDKMPKVYAIPGVTPENGTETHFRVFVGNGAVFDYVRSSKITEIADGTSNTFMVVTAAKAVPWTKPDELEFDPDKDMGTLLGKFHNRIMVAFCDGSVRTFLKPPAKDTLKAYITRAGGEVIPFDNE
jgi:hypothetical protein